MKKACFSLLTALLLLPLLCFSAQAADTSSTTVQAFRPSEDGLIVVDGSADEIFWLLDTPVGTSRLGALCDGYGLYLAFETQAGTAEFTVNGVSVSCTLGTSPSAGIGTIKGQNGVYELRLGYSDIKLPLQATPTLPFTAVIGDDSVSGNLVVNALALAPTGTGKNLTGADYYNSLHPSSDATGNITVSKDGIFTFRNDGNSDTYNCLTKSGTDWAKLNLPGFTMAFEADFNKLPVSSTRPYMYHFGLFWVVSDGDDRYDMAFWADDNGQIRFTVHQATIADARTKALPTGIYLGSDAAQDVRVRILMDADHNVTLYLNGVKIGTLLADPNPPSGSSSISGRLQFYADHRNRDSVEHSVDVTFSDFSFRELTAAEPRAIYSYARTFYSGDNAPTAQKVAGYSRDRFVTLDTNHSSVVLDQKSSQRFNRIHLFDTDEVSRVSQNDLGVFVSTTGEANSWKKVTGWQLHQSGTRYTIYNLDETARYIKVHCYLDNLNDLEDSTPFAPSFSNYISDMISVEYSPYLLGADSDFTWSGSLSINNPSGTDLYDEPVQIALPEIGAHTGEYLASCADFRFTSGSRLLPHWYDGDGTFHVRVPHIPAGGSTTIIPHWGNPDAEDVSDREATFEAVYGNTSLIDLSKNTNLVGSGRSFTFPDGSIVTVARAKGGVGLSATRSLDGGRTFIAESVDLIPSTHSANGAGFGSFIWDPTIGDKGRLMLMAYHVYAEKADCRFIYLYTDNYGETWSDPVLLCDASADMTKLNDGEKYLTIQNSQGRFYQLSYCDGLTLKDADGADGPNVDYVLTHSYLRSDTTFASSALYSTDGGKTWIASSSEIAMERNTVAHENGISETAFAQLDDGSLYILARAQETSNLYFYESRSYDCGKTWTTAQASQVLSTNTSPVMLPYGKDRLLMWAGNSSISGTARRRFPLTLAISSDNYASYDRSLNLTLGTAYDTMETAVEHITQPSLSLSPDGNEAFACWTNLRESTTVGMLIEEFGDMIYKTRGAFDGFECTAIKGEGWLLGERNAGVYSTAGKVIISTDKARSGSHSMCVTDDSVYYPDDPDTSANEAGHRRVYVLRQIPSMRTGTVGISLYVPSGNTTDFVFELKPAYNYSYGKFTVAGFGIKADGSLFRVVGNSVITTIRESLNKTVSLDAWHDYSIGFDMVDTKKGTLFVDGDPVATFNLFGDYDRITVAELSEYEPTGSTGSVIYVDDFYAIEPADGITVAAGGTRLPVSDSIPTQDGCVFGGWFADAAHTIPYTATTGYAYAKFVDQDVLRVKVQISANTARATQKTDLRLLTSVDNANYDRVGFKVTIGAKTQIISSSKVFRRIVANEGGIVCYHSPNVFSEQSRYFMTYTITNVPNAAFGAEIRVVPFWITLDGTEVTGEELSFTVNDVIDHGSSGLSSSSQGSGDSESFEDMFAPQT